MIKHARNLVNASCDGQDMAVLHLSLLHFIVISFPYSILSTIFLPGFFFRNKVNTQTNIFHM